MTSANNHSVPDKKRDTHALAPQNLPTLWRIGVFVVTAGVVYMLVKSWIPEPSAEIPLENAVAPVETPRQSTETVSQESTFEPTVASTAPEPGPTPEGMVWIPGGEFSMGCADPRGEPAGGPDPMGDSRPIHRVYVDGFWMDRTEVTNRQFAEFIKATDYITIAERVPQAKDFPDAPPENLVAGGVVFTPPPEAVPLDNHFRWWNYVPGANWRHPSGPDSNIDGKDDFPVVQIAYADALAYAAWAGKRIPTEAEWEFAARGGLTGQLYAWGNELRPQNKWMANTWQGEFPIQNSNDDGFAATAPVAQFSPNGYGLHDIAGNVWEWCSDWYDVAEYAHRVEAHGTEVIRNPQGPAASFDPAEPTEKKRVHRGGSFLCTDQYCTRYMIGTRGKGEVSTGTNHLGFRCVRPSSQ